MSAEEASPLLVAILVIGILVVGQPLESTFGGISMNWIAVAVVAIGGLAGSLQ